MSKDRALTIKQPWASLIMAGVKDVENRSWPVPATLWRERRAKWPNQRNPATTDYISPFPFRLWVHSAARTSEREWSSAEQIDSDHVAALTIKWNPLGYLLGSVLVTGCHLADDCGTEYDDVSAHILAPFCSPWAEPDVYHWTLTDPQPLAEPIPMKGRQGLWRIPHNAGGFLVGSSPPSTPSTSAD